MSELKPITYTTPSVDDLFAGKMSRYALAIAVAKRAREITDAINEDRIRECDKPVLAAVDEFKKNKFIIREPNIDD